MSPQVNLQPVAKSDEALLGYLDLNFRRLADAIQSLADVQFGTNAFTGTVTIDSGIPNLQQVIACLAVPPAAGACFVVAAPVGAAQPRQFVLTSYSNAFAQSVIATTVAWIAIGMP